MSIEDKTTNEKVIKLYFNQHKTIREVCRILGKSSRDVLPIIKEHRLRIAPNDRNVTEQEKDTILPAVKAYRLFSGGKNPVEVVTRLNLPGPLVQQHYAEYWRLRNMHELLEIYNEIKGDLEYFVKLIRLGKKENLTPEEIIGLINVSSDIRELKGQLKQHRINVGNLVSEQHARKAELKKLDDQIAAAADFLERKSELITQKTEILSKLISQKQKLENRIEQVKDSQDYREIQQIASDKVTELLSDNKKLLNYALDSIITVLRSDSDRRFLIETLQSRLITSTIIDSRPLWESKRPPVEEPFIKERVLENANRMLDRIKKGIIDKTIATAAGLDKDSFTN